MWFLLLIFMAASVDASCGTNRLEYYRSLIRKGNTDAAFALVLKDLSATPEEKKLISLEATTGMPSTTPFAVSINDLQESKSLACQHTAAILSKMRDQKRARQAIRQYHQEWDVSPQQWSGCDIENQDLSDPEVAARIAIGCLEESSFTSHESAMDIRAYLAQSRAADAPRLRDEDAEGMLVQMRLFFDNVVMLDEHSSDNFYLASLKRTDRASFCEGVRFVRDTLKQRTPETRKWQKACLPVSE